MRPLPSAQALETGFPQVEARPRVVIRAVFLTRSHLCSDRRALPRSGRHHGRRGSDLHLLVAAADGLG